MTRGDLTLPEIYNSVFSRNNSIYVANVTTDLEFEPGRGPTTIIGVSTGGSVAVTNNNGKVTVYTDDPAPSAPDYKEESKATPQPSPSQPGYKEEDNSAPQEGEGYPEDSNSSAEEPVPEPSADEGLDDAYFALMSDWDKFVTHEMWDVQETPTPTAEAPADEMETSSRIINGVYFGSGIPSGSQFAVKFFYNNEENFYCSGSLIGYPYALTAAHCGVVEGDQVRVGARLLRSGYKATAAEVVIHPDFDPSSLVNDLAIVRLEGLESEKVLRQNGVRAARVNRNSSFPEEDFVGIVSAHGSVETDGQGVSTELRTTRHTIYGMDKCRDEITQGDLGKEKSYICAGDGERSTTCVGDSGAGLWRYRVRQRKDGKVRKFYEVFGVVSFGEVTDESLCPRGPPSVFQRTSANFKWIQTVVGKENMA
ncbi:serine protease P128 [Gracilaria domingensis]|nr:serine protease P128 [Gracilaria domingensis]